MSSSYVGEIRLVGFNFAPQGWAFCDGSLLSIANNEVLFTLLGTTYGGDGVNTFALPNLTGRVPVHQGTGQSNYVMGQTGGVASVTLTTNQMPIHTHTVNGQSGIGNAVSPVNNYFAGSTPAIYSLPSGYVNMGSVVGLTGGSQAHDNMQPYLAMNYIISLFGIYPSQN